MDNKSSMHAVIWSLILGSSLIVTGIILGNALSGIKSVDRFVTVRGLAEREVSADLAIWPLTFIETGNDLSALQKTIDEKRTIISAFLVQTGFKPTEISQSAPKIRDNQAEVYGQEVKNKFRYISQTTVLLRSENVSLLKQAMENAGKLVSQGVVLAMDWQNRNEFLFTGLNTIKPEMIEEATMNARNAAEKFAKDSGSKLGKIRSATQGLFTISDRDMNSPDRKNVRVVTTVEYYLVDE